MSAVRSVTLEPGVWSVVPTPFRGPDDELDEESLVTLASFYERVGVAGLTVLGVFGESARLSMAERRRVLQVVANSSALPLVVGITALATAPAVEEAATLAAAAEGRVVAMMAQVGCADARCLRTHFRRLHEATGLAVVVQDYPQASGVTVGPRVLADALKGEPWVAGVKAESPPTALAVGHLAMALREVPVFGGLGGVGLLDELAAGAAGAMTGFSFPEGLRDCVAAYGEGGFAPARAALLPYLPLVCFEQQPGIGLGIRKEALRRRGLLREALVRAPGTPMPKELSGQLDRHMEAASSAALGPARPPARGTMHA
ncbi:MAG: dihydrodipicolinate synthase family protein [Actinomycetota bacterium]|jgi:4-hydroxy-tetrahydrodipicolinate synthase|nr:dihydrodipicolinate synthase family protein [Actinomycetota bacterium]